MLVFVRPALCAFCVIIRYFSGAPSIDEDDSDDEYRGDMLSHPGLPVAVMRQQQTAGIRRWMRSCLRCGVAFFIIAAACWELVAVLELREHRQRTGINGDGPLCATGPYGLSRHPINVGLLCTALGFTLAYPSLLGLAGSLIFTIHLMSKTRDEEQWLQDHYGLEKWEAYAAMTPMLLPYSIYAPLVVAFSACLLVRLYQYFCFFSSSSSSCSTFSSSSSAPFSATTTTKEAKTSRKPV